jgi:hypothetical protein
MDSAQLINIPRNDYISSFSIAQMMVDGACQSHTAYWSVIEACQKHLSGAKPVPHDELKKKGLSWADNFNYNKGKAKLTKGTAESCARVSDALALGYVTFRAGTPDDNKGPLSFLNDENLRGVVASGIGAAFVSTLQQEDRLSSWLNDVEYPSYAYGYAAAIYIPDDWMPEVVHPLHIAFKPQTRPDEITSWVTFREVPGIELFDAWSKAYNQRAQATLNDKGDTERLVSSGWNLEGLEQVLLRCFKGRDKDNKQPEQWAEVMDDVRTRCSWVMQNTDSCNIAKIFYRELDGSLSEVHIPYQNTWQMAKEDFQRARVTTSGAEAVGAIIFKKNHGPYTQSKHIQLIRDSGFSETGYIQDCRGLAQFVVEDSIRYNRLRNGIGNKMKLVGSPMFTSSTTVNSDKFKLNVSQGFTILSPGFDLVEKQPNYDIASHIAVLKFEEDEHTRDTQQFDPSIQGRISSRPNKDEVRNATAEVSATKAAKNTVKFKDYAALFFQVISRLGTRNFISTDKGKEGQDRFYRLALKQLSGIINTKEDLKKVLGCIDSYTITPLLSDIETITIAIQMCETPFGRNRFKRMLLLAKGLPIEEVNHAVPLISDKFVGLQDQRIAMFEDDSFWNGNEVVIQGSDDHIVHLDVHMQKMMTVIQGVLQNGALPADKGAPYLQNLMEHIVGHLQMLGQDPILNVKAQEYIANFKKLKQGADQVFVAAQKMAEAAQEAANQPAPLDPETEAEIRRKDALAESKERRTDFLTQVRTDQANRKIEVDAALKQRQQDLDHQIKLMEAQNSQQIRAIQQTPVE